MRSLPFCAHKQSQKAMTAYDDDFLTREGVGVILIYELYRAYARFQDSIRERKNAT